MKVFIFALFAVCVVVGTTCNCTPKNVPFGVCPQVNGINATYLLDVYKRNIFYECNNGVPYEQQCPAGLVFNPILNICDYPCLNCKPYGPVGTCKNCTKTILEYLRDGMSTSVFYVCNLEEPVMYTCAKGKMFSTQLKVCVDVV